MNSLLLACKPGCDECTYTTSGVETCIKCTAGYADNSGTCVGKYGTPMSNYVQE